MAEDLLEKGAILPRVKETYAIASHVLGGIITDFLLSDFLVDNFMEFYATMPSSKVSGP